jgi:hypothetical protein
MQYAQCTSDNRTWEAMDFSRLPIFELEDKRKNLICKECGEFAWFRKESRHGHPAHFCAHHNESCSLRIEYIVDGQRNETTLTESEITSGNSIVVFLNKEKGNEIDVVEVQSSPAYGYGEGGRSFILHGSEKESAEHATLRKILLRLVQSPDFSFSNKQLTLYKNEQEILINGLVRDVIVNFENIKFDQHDERTMLFWGPIASSGKTPDNKLWLNSSDRYQGVSIAIVEDIVGEFYKTFHIEDLDDLAGSYVLVAGKCYVSPSTKKPVIWCTSPKNIIVRRYKSENLQAQL